MKWWKRAVGEMSRLRQVVGQSMNMITGSAGKAWKLDSSRVDYAKAKALYENTDTGYKLGAGFAKKIINSVVGFMGIPEFKHDDDEAKEILKSFADRNRSKMQDVERNALRDGDAFVWITREERKSILYPEEDTRLVFNILPPEMVKHINRDPVTNEAIEYILLADQTWIDDRGKEYKYTVEQRIKADIRKIMITKGNAPPGFEVGELLNPWGFIPIIHFANENDASEAFGRSDLEPVEPFLKAYHDIFLHSIQGSRMHSTPRLKFNLKDVAAFLSNNFGIVDPAEFAKKGEKIELDGHEFFIFTEGETAEFIEVKSAIGSAKELLQLLFYCIVSASEVPEFIFGSHTPSSLSSVKEQMPVFIQKVWRKREQFTEPWQIIARMVLAMTAQAENLSFTSYESELIWEEVDPRDSKEAAEELKIVVEALAKAVQNQLMSLEAAVQYTKKYVDTMNDYESDDPNVKSEKDRIVESLIFKARLEDASSLDAERKLLNKGA